MKMTILTEVVIIKTSCQVKDHFKMRKRKNIKLIKKEDVQMNLNLPGGDRFGRSWRF